MDQQAVGRLTAYFPVEGAPTETLPGRNAETDRVLEGIFEGSTW
jgi:hypothetical protein